MISDARKVSYDKSNPILFDTNVWLSLYAPPSGGNDSWAVVYSAVLKRIVECNVPVLIDSTVLGEYINRYCRIEFQAYEDCAHPNSKRSFKEFRTHEPDTYRAIATDVVSRVKEMFEIPGIRRINGDFKAIDMSVMLTEFAQGSSDWNDQLIVDICRRNACSLLTNDADFENASINILTCNNKLLKTVRRKDGRT